MDASGVKLEIAKHPDKDKYANENKNKVKKNDNGPEKNQKAGRKWSINHVHGTSKQSKICKLVMIVMSRVLFILHSLVSIWRVADIFGDIAWLGSIGVVPYFIDIYVVLKHRRGQEWTWFQPIILLYLMMELTCIGLLELHNVSTIQVKHNITPILATVYESNFTGTRYLPEFIQVDISNELWALLLEQTMLFLIIIARWMMPKGQLSRSQLSALLLSYLGMAADVVDFFSVLAEDDTLLLDLTFVFTILGVSAWSMAQFIFVSSMKSSSTIVDDGYNHIQTLLRSKSLKEKYSDPEAALTTEPEKRKVSRGCTGRLQTFIESEMWSIFVSLLLQDGPYGTVRLVCIFYWGIRSNIFYFFVCKNILSVFVQLYRIVVIYTEHNQEWVDRESKKIEIEQEFRDYIRTAGSSKPGHSVDVKL